MSLHDLSHLVTCLLQWVQQQTTAPQPALKPLAFDTPHPARLKLHASVGLCWYSAGLAGEWLSLVAQAAQELHFVRCEASSSQQNNARRYQLPLLLSTSDRSILVKDVVLQ